MLELFLMELEETIQSIPEFDEETANGRSFS